MYFKGDMWPTQGPNRPPLVQKRYVTDTGPQLTSMIKKSRNGDTLGPVELIVWPEQGNQGDWREQDG